jgi:hypothetical protein
MKTRTLLLLTSILGCNLFSAFSQDNQEVKRLEVYGFTQLDAGYNAGQIDPNWFDVVRPTKLSAFKDEWAPDGNVYFSVRQTRFGVKGFTPTKLGTLKTTFEFELFGTGIDAGQTTLRLRHAYGELGKWGFGQTWSPFMDIDVFPNSVEYWGPSGMVFFRNIQARYMPIQGDTRMTIALERPGASAEQGPYNDEITSMSNIRPNFSLPDLSAEYRAAQKWGYIELAGIVRQIKWKDIDNTGTDLSGNTLGWGLNLSTNIKAGSNDVIKASVVYGAGIENYMNDATSDVGIENPDNNLVADDVKPLTLTGIVAFLDHKWNDQYSTSIGYSSIMIDNKDVFDNTFKKGQYALVNLLYTPVENMMAGVEFQWGSRDNERADASGYDGTTISKVQLSFKYNFGATIK